MPSVLIVTPIFPPSGGGGVMRMAKLAKYLPSLGWSVTVLSADVRYPEVLDPALAAELPGSVHVVRLRSPLSILVDRAAGGAVAAQRSGGRGSVVGPLVRVGRAVLVPDRWVLWSLMAGRTRIAPGDVVLSSGPPHSAHLAGARLARRFGVPHVMDLRDAWAENAFGLRVAPWQAAVDRWLERRLMTRASAVVVPVPEYIQEVRSRYPDLPAALRAITNGFDTDDVSGVPTRRVPYASDTIEFLYAGRLVGSQRIDRLAEVLGALAAQGRPHLRLRLLGQVDPGPARAAVRSLGPSVSFGRPVPHRDAIRAMSQADVLIVVAAGGGMGEVTLTGKIFECLALRRPVLLIASKGPAVELITSTGGGAWAAPDDPMAIERAVGEVVAMARSPSFSGASDDALAPFTRAALASEWVRLLEGAVKAG